MKTPKEIDYHGYNLMMDRFKIMTDAKKSASQLLIHWLITREQHDKIVNEATDRYNEAMRFHHALVAKYKLNAKEKGTPMRVNPYVSDLFFNHDVTEARIYDDGMFDGYDHDKMLELAQNVIDCLYGLGLSDYYVPEAEELVADFYERC